jgi:hypothetical protein
LHTHTHTHTPTYRLVVSQIENSEAVNGAPLLFKQGEGHSHGDANSGARSVAKSGGNSDVNSDGAVAGATQISIVDVSSDRKDLHTFERRKRNSDVVENDRSVVGIATAEGRSDERREKRGKRKKKGDANALQTKGGVVNDVVIEAVDAHAGEEFVPG